MTLTYDRIKRLDYIKKRKAQLYDDLKQLEYEENLLRLNRNNDLIGAISIRDTTPTSREHSGIFKAKDSINEECSGIFKK